MLNLNATPLRSLDFDQFESELCSTCGRFGIVPFDGQRCVEGVLDAESRAGLDIAYVGQNVDTVFRAEKHIRSDPGSHYFLIIQHKGQSQLVQGDVSEKMRVGDMFLVDSTCPSRYHYGGKNSLQIALHLPRDEMHHRFGSSIYGGIHISNKDPLSQAMRLVLSELFASQRVGQAHVVEAFYSVFGAFLLNRRLGAASKPNLNQVTISRALGVMAQHFRDPDFTPNHAADLVGVSLRQMQRIFKARAVGPHQSLQGFRLDAASELIANEQGKPGVSISSIAFQCGFTDLSTFYRQFKARHGHAPSEGVKHSRDMQ